MWRNGIKIPYQILVTSSDNYQLVKSIALQRQGWPKKKKVRSCLRWGQSDGWQVRPPTIGDSALGRAPVRQTFRCSDGPRSCQTTRGDRPSQNEVSVAGCDHCAVFEVRSRRQQTSERTRQYVVASNFNFPWCKIWVSHII